MAHPPQGPFTLDPYTQFISERERLRLEQQIQNMSTQTAPIAPDLEEAIKQETLRQLNAEEATKAKPKEDKPLKCPKCGAFAERVLVAKDNRLPGLFCNKEGCGWTATLDVLPVRLREWTYVIHQSIHELLRLAPLNPVARTHVHSKVGIPIPPVCTTLAQILQWIETVELKKGVLSSDEIPFNLPTLPRWAPTNALSIEVGYSYRESGRASYSCTQYGCRNYELGRDDIAEMAEECGSLSELETVVKRRFRAMCGENPPNTEASDYDYSDEEATDSDDHETEIHEETLRTKLAEWLRNHLPAEYDRLNT